MNSAQIRDELVRTLKLDLIGPELGDARENEVLDRAPSREYLAGFLIPFEPPTGRIKQDVGSDETEQEQIDLFSNKPATDDDNTPETGSGRRAFFPSSMGISVLVPEGASSIAATVEWGDYKRVESNGKDDDGKASGSREQWKRTQCRQKMKVSVGSPSDKPKSVDVPESEGLKLFTSVRKVPPSDDGGFPPELVPPGTRSVSVFLVNYRRPAPDAKREEAFVFQVRLILSMEIPFVPRPNLRGLVASETDTDE